MDLDFFSLKSSVDKTSNVWTCVCLGACVYENLCFNVSIQNRITLFSLLISGLREKNN